MASARLNIVRRRESVAELERLGADAVMTMSPPPLRATSTRASRRRSATAVPSSSIRQRSIQTCVLSRSLGRAGLTPASTAPPSARSPPCSLRSGPACARCRWSRFAITSSAAAPCISITASRSTPGTSARRPAGSVRKEVAVQWNVSHVRLLDPRTGQLLREHRRHARRGQHAIHPDDRPARTPWTERPLPEVVRVAYPLWQRLLGGQRPSLGGYVTGTGARVGARRWRALTLPSIFCPQSLMKYRSQLLAIARVLLGRNSCSKRNDCGQEIGNINALRRRAPHSWLPSA